MDLFELVGVVSVLVVGGGLILWGLSAVHDGWEQAVPEEDEHAQGLSAPWNRSKR